MDISKLVGLYIETNRYKFEPVKAWQAKEVFAKLSEYCGLSNLRRITGTNTFTGYVYNHNECDLEETLKEYLSK